MVTDPISDMLATIRNGQQVRLAQVSTPASKIKQGILAVLQEEGYINDFAEQEVRTGVKRITINLKYHEGQPVIREINRVSTPGLRRYCPIGKLPKVHNGLGLSILSTSKGIFADYKAKEANVGGEIICNVF